MDPDTTTLDLAPAPVRTWLDHATVVDDTPLWMAWEAAQNAWLESKRRKSGRDNTIRAYSLALRQFFDWAAVEPWVVSPGHAQEWAIHLSTISTHLNLGASYATRDLYQHYFNPRASDKELVWVGRVSTFILLLGSFLYGLMMQEITQWLIFALWIMAAGIWLPSILQVVWWRFNAWGYLSSWIANLGLSWLIVWVLPEFRVIPVLPDYLQFWLMMILGALIYIPITFLTPPEDMDRLVKYYVMSRPLGRWKPVREQAQRQGLLQTENQPSGGGG